MLSVRKSVKRLTDRFLLPDEATISGIDLCRNFKPSPKGSLKALLTLMNQISDSALPTGGSTRPYYRRRMPAPQDVANYDSDGFHIDLRNVASVPYRPEDISETQWLNIALATFDARAASVILDSANPTYIFEQQPLAGQGIYDWGYERVKGLSNAFLEAKDSSNKTVDVFDASASAPKFYTLRSSSLAMMAYNDFLNDNRTLSSAIPSDVYYEPPFLLPVARGRAGERIGDYLRDLVNVGIMNASPGYCGSFGPGVDGTFSLQASEGNYDMTQTHLISLAYNYYDELTPDAREHLIRQLLAGGIIHRPNESDITTSGPLPDDWARAGHISPLALPKDIGETENHIISMLSTRYLTNQLLYQRDPNPDYDNRRNARAGPTCMSLVLAQLRNILRCDFSEYNAKSYQEETRWPILNLATYAYDHEVRLAARMVLDYVSAHIAVSSNDLRRIVPFRRRNELLNVQREWGVMVLGIVDVLSGADPMSPYFAIQAGNLRVYETPNLAGINQALPVDPVKNPSVRPWTFGIATDGGDVTKEVLSTYRLPPLIHDLFVNDLHRRFFQRLHRTRQDEAEGSRNCDNYELYASSPSYLITAGGQPAEYAISPYFGGFPFGDQAQQIGVAMTTSFMPTGQSAGRGTQNSARDLIQLSHFSDKFDSHWGPEYLNYGVAPDFACGYGLYLPSWAKENMIPPFSDAPGLYVVDRHSDGTQAGFYLAIFKFGDYTLLEAFDTWLHPEVTKGMFSGTVVRQNKGLDLSAKGSSIVTGVYTTYYGTQIQFTIWPGGASTSNIVYSNVHPTDSQGDAGNVTGPFLNGTIMNSTREAVVEISNPFYGPPGTKIILDLYDREHPHPRRVSETGDVEQAGYNNEVWVNFGWTGPTEGDFFHPFNTLSAAVNAVAESGVIKVVPGWTTERPSVAAKKRCKIVAPLGGVRIGVQ